MLSQVDGAWSKVRRHKSAKVWQIKSLSGSWEQIAPMHASSHLPFSLSSPYIPPPLFAFFHCSPHFTLSTSIPPPCLFFPSFLLSVLMRLFQNVQLSPLSCYVFCRMYPFSSRSFASIQYYSYAFLFSPFSLHYCNHSCVRSHRAYFYFSSLFRLNYRNQL